MGLGAFLLGRRSSAVADEARRVVQVATDSAGGEAALLAWEAASRLACPDADWLREQLVTSSVAAASCCCATYDGSLPLRDHPGAPEALCRRVLGQLLSSATFRASAENLSLAHDLVLGVAAHGLSKGADTSRVSSAVFRLALEYLMNFDCRALLAGDRQIESLVFSLLPLADAVIVERLCDSAARRWVSRHFFGALPLPVATALLGATLAEGPWFLVRLAAVFVARFVERRTAAPSALADPQEETAGLAAFLAGVSLADLASLMETAQQLCVPKGSAKLPALVSPSQLQQREQREQQRQQQRSAVRLATAAPLETEQFDWVGFDLDHTLIEVEAVAARELIFGAVMRHLAESMPEDEDRAWAAGLRLGAPLAALSRKGLVVDRLTGSLLQLDARGHVVFGFLGTRPLSAPALMEAQDADGLDHEPTAVVEVLDTEIVTPPPPLSGGEGASTDPNEGAGPAQQQPQQHPPYSQHHHAHTAAHLRRNSSKRFSVLNTAYDQPLGAALAAIMDRLLLAKPNPSTELRHSWLERLFRSFMFCQSRFCSYGLEARLESAPESLIAAQVEMRRWLEQRRRTKLRVFLLTNSDWTHVERCMPVAYGARWRELFDLVITDANKHKFFASQQPFSSETRAGAEGALRGGNAEALTGKHLAEALEPGVRPRVLYVGDHVLQDCVYPKRHSGWSTVSVMAEQGDWLLDGTSAQGGRSLLGGWVDQEALATIRSVEFFPSLFKVQPLTRLSRLSAVARSSRVLSDVARSSRVISVSGMLLQGRPSARTKPSPRSSSSQTGS
jgi:hypothetical protein